MIRTSIKCETCGDTFSKSNITKHQKSCDGSKKHTPLDNCPFCHLDIDSLKPQQIGGHVRWCTKNPNRKQKTVFYVKKGGFTGHTETTKQILSQKRIEWLKSNKDKHPWKHNDKFKSKPCEHLKQILKENNIDFYEEFTPNIERNYSIDIVIKNTNIGLEVNGNQHYSKDGKLKDYYQQRHDILNQNGWDLIEIHYSNVYKQKFIIELLNKIKGYDSNLDLTFLLEKKTKNVNLCDCGKQIFVKSKNCIDCNSLKNRKVDRPPHDVILEDVQKLGYVGTGKKYGVSDNAIRKWIKNGCKIKGLMM